MPLEDPVMITIFPWTSAVIGKVGSLSFSHEGFIDRTRPAFGVTRDAVTKVTTVTYGDSAPIPAPSTKNVRIEWQTRLPST